MSIDDLCKKLFLTINPNIPSDINEFKFTYGIDGVATRTSIKILNKQGKWEGGSYGTIGYENTKAINQYRKTHCASLEDDWVKMEIVFNRSGGYQVDYFYDDAGVFND